MAILFLGDIMLGRHVTPLVDQYGLRCLFEPLSELFRDNHVIANLESPLTECGCPLQGKSPILYGAPELASGLKGAGFSGFSLANNHIFDCGPQGLLDTIELLDHYDILHTGSGVDLDAATKPIILELDTVKVGIVAFSYLNPAAEKKAGTAYLYDQTVENCIGSVRGQVDFLIAMPHSGIELFQYPLPRDQKRYRTMIERGVDLVVGSHPHCVQAMEIYKGKHIFYSIGDCVFDHHEPTVWDRFWKKGGNTEKFGIKATSELPCRSLAISVEISEQELQVSYQPLIMQNPPISQIMSQDTRIDWLKHFEKLCSALSSDPEVTNERNEIERQLIASLQGRS